MTRIYGDITKEEQPESLDTQEQWPANAAHLPKQAFRQIAHPHGHSFLGIPLQMRGKCMRRITTR